MKKKSTFIHLKGIGSFSYVKDEVWSLIHYFTSEGFEQKDYAVLLFILVLNNEGIFDKITIAKKEKLNENILLRISNLKDKEKAKLLQELFDFYSEALFSLSKDSLQSLLNDLKDLEELPSLESEQSVLNENFSEVFDFVLYKLAKLAGKSAGEYILPKELARFVSELSEVTDKSIVYNPFAGEASFAVFFENNPFFIAEEINENIRAIGMLRLLAYGKEKRSVFQLGNSIKDWSYDDFKDDDPLGKFKFDLIVSNPPFGRLATDINGQFGTIKTYEHFLIEKGIKSLKSNGKIVAILTPGFLFRGGSEQRLRESLIKEDSVEMIIALPGSLLLQTSIKVVILVLNKNKSNKGKVRFVDGSSAFKNTNGKENIFDEIGIKNILEEGLNSQFSCIVSNTLIAENDFNLSVSRYLISQIAIDEDESLVKLQDVTTSILRKRSVVGEYGTLIRIRDLKDDAIDFQLRLDLPQDVEIPINSQKIEESCLLLAVRWNKLKPTWFNYIGSPIFISNDIYPIKVDSTKIDTAFLVNELCCDYVTDQIKSYQTGVTVPSLRKEDLLRIKIKLPEYHFHKKFSESLKEQRAKVKGLREEMIRNKEKALSMEKELLNIQKDSFRELASIKHTLRQYLNALKSNVSGTRKFINKNENRHISLNSVYSENLNQTVGDHLSNLENTIDSMSKLLSEQNEEISDNKVVEVEMNMENLITYTQQKFQNPEIFQFERLYIDEESFTFDDGGKILPNVNIDMEDFYKLFSNIISNAIDHGFKGRKSHKNIIRTSLSFDSELNQIVIEISNNGKPMPQEFTLKHLTTRWEKTSDSVGSGIGGADIKRILDKYAASLEIKNEPLGDFPVTYIIRFPLAISFDY